MDKAAIKKFAVSARKKLIEAVEQKAFELGITADEVKDAEIYQDGFLINGIFYKKYQINQRGKLLKEMEQKGYDQVIEEVAYTWFNRLIALRFMEVNDYLPTGIRIFSSIEKGKKEPDALTEVELLIDDLDLEVEKVYELQDANDDEDLFKYIFIKQCNKLGEMMPMMFEAIEDYTELLLPNNLLAETSVIHDMVTEIDEADWTKEVEIIGWLYQYYISEKKDQVFADLKKNKKISKENIPAATELFTPRWIVQYMVDNSLGRLWLESHPNETLQGKLPYYLEAAEQPEDVIEQLESLKDPNLKLEDIKFLDPCMGSGHILVYAFEVFVELYKSQGYREQDIPKLIIEHNLYGLDLDPRAAQLAYFAVVMKARSFSNRLFDQPIETNLYWIEDSLQITEQDVDLFVGDTDLREDFTELLETFKDGKLLGSIIEVPELDLIGIKERVHYFEQNQVDDIFALDFKENKLPIIERIIDQAIVLEQKYDVVVTNPPYMGRKGMKPELTKYLNKNYPTTKSDLFSAMMERIESLVTENGFSALVTMQSWMFLSSFEKYRQHLLDNYSIVTLTHMANMVMGIAFGTAATVFRKKVPDYKGVFQYIKYEDIVDEKPYEFPIIKNRYSTISGESFSDIPGSPIAYWVSEQLLKAFNVGEIIKGKGDTRQGMATSDNNRFLRLWFEVNTKNIGLNYSNSNDAKESGKKWFPYNKGGSFKKWYGNRDYLINYKNDGEEVKNLASSKYKSFTRTIKSISEYFKSSISWSKISSGSIAFRYYPEGHIFDVAGCSIFFENEEEKIFSLGFLNSKVVHQLLEILSPTLNYEAGDIAKLPIIYDQAHFNDVQSFVEININLSQSDWDSFETSWDFETHPFIEFQQESTKISDAFSNWQMEAENRFQTLKANEEELNRIFIDLYGLQDELTPEVEDKDVTIRRADQLRDVKSFLSYTVGLMFGRYSLDQPGLAYAGGEFDLTNYQTFIPDEDNVLPIATDVYFEDDIVNRLITIIKTIFGSDHLEENLDFIADTLTRRANETSRQRIRRYFLKEFYKDHVQTYQKRPIYWLFDSGKQDGFKALVYLHRYKPDLVARVRTSYLHAQVKKYQDEMTRLDYVLEADVSKTEQTKAKKLKEVLQKQVQECLNYDQVIAHVAHQTLDLDLDDGVKVNYAKFQNIEVPQGEGKKPLKANVLAKI
ncbi:MAG TPA: BREX-1 system adenine-specific DNA-methyltransferase PglX [Bacilli bacterium]|nr:BREX-1 system adenine-specific DNA-methyltransferase PglX [Bacilli bacterium]